jgi:hypothetical protein
MGLRRSANGIKPWAPDEGSRSDRSVGVHHCLLHCFPITSFPLELRSLLWFR